MTHRVKRELTFKSLLEHNMTIALGVSLMFGPLIYFAVQNKKRQGSV